MSENAHVGTQASPSLSVVIPSYNADQDLHRCLQALRSHNGTEVEIVVVDDASTRGNTAAVAAAHGARYLRLPENSGPAVARNAGVIAASGELILFIDADVVVHPHAVEQALHALEADTGLGAAFGSYDENPAQAGFLSQYRNLYHRWVHQHGEKEASTFWTGCGVVRRVAFDAVGGFNPALSHRGMEDIDLGYRLRDAGYRIALLKHMECQHLKKWTLRSMVKTDIFHRGVPWMLILLARPGSEKDLNINHRARSATLAAALLPPTLLGAIFYPWLVLVAAGLTLLVVGLQWGFYRYVAGLRGAGFALRVVPFQLLFFGCCAISIPLALGLQLTGQGLHPGPAEDGPNIQRD
jgi:GT2 family glycosyltransferase